MRGSRLTLLDKGGDPYLWSKENIFSRNGSREAILEIGYLRRYIDGYFKIVHHFLSQIVSSLFYLFSRVKEYCTNKLFNINHLNFQFEITITYTNYKDN